MGKESENLRWKTGARQRMEMGENMNIRPKIKESFRAFYLRMHKKAPAYNKEYWKAHYYEHKMKVEINRLGKKIGFKPDFLLNYEDRLKKAKSLSGGDWARAVMKNWEYFQKDIGVKAASSDTPWDNDMLDYNTFNAVADMVADYGLSYAGGATRRYLEENPGEAEAYAFGERADRELLAAVIADYWTAQGKYIKR